MRVRLDVYCASSCRDLIGTWWDEIEEKYPFNCENCGQTDWRYPWKIVATVVASDLPSAPAPPDGT